MEPLRAIRELTHHRRHGDALREAQNLLAQGGDTTDLLHLVAVNQRFLHQIPAALTTLERLERLNPDFGRLHQERGHCYLALRDPTRAIEAFEIAVRKNPALPDSWTLLERLHRGRGDVKSASAAATQLASLEGLPSAVVRAGSLFSDGELTAADALLREFLNVDPRHLEAMRLLARVARSLGDFAEAELLLRAILNLNALHRLALEDLARLLIERQKYREARDAALELCGIEAGEGTHRALYAGACAGVGDHAEAIKIYRELLRQAPGSAEFHMALGQCLRAEGHAVEAIHEFRAAASVRPRLGDAYWSLANLKTYRFSASEIDHLRMLEALPDTSPADRWHLCFTLGKALEDSQQYAESWRSYDAGNALKRAASPYVPSTIDARAAAQAELCTSAFFAARADYGVPDCDPIFIVGLPRSGSTLIEQILASHSQVDATQELPFIQHIIDSLHRNSRSIGGYPHMLQTLGADQCRELGERYLADARAYRGGRPYFIDKMPNNFQHLGLIRLMLPNATIIDARREPMACGFSNFKQLFASGQEFSYGLDTIAHYQRSYLSVMRHWNQVLPRSVLRVCYEDLVGDLEGTVRALLDFCGLDFEASCLDFHHSARAVRTASSEQVRQPLFREALTQWRSFEPWLAPLADALGDAPSRYRE